MAVNMAAAFRAVRSEAVSLERALSTGTYDRFATAMARVTEQLRGLKQVALSKELEASGGWTRSMTQALDLAQRKVIELRAALGSGAYDAFAGKMATVNRELQQLQRAAHFKDLTAQHGVFMGSLVYGAERVRDWAGKIGSAFGSIQQALAPVLQSLPTLGEVAGHVARGAPAAFERWSRATQDLSGAFGQVLLPILQRATIVVRSIADWVFNMPSGLRTLTVAVVGFGIAFTAAAALAVTAIGTIIAAMAVLDVETAGIPIIIGAIVTGVAALAGAVGGIAAAVGTTMDFGKAWDNVMRAVQPITNVVNAIVVAIEKFAQGFWDVISVVINQAKPSFDELFQSFNTLAAAIGLGNDGWQTLGGLIGQLVSGPLSFLVQVVITINEALTWMVELVTASTVGFAAMWEAVKGGDFNQAFNRLMGEAKAGGKLLSNPQPGTSFGAGGFQANLEQFEQSRSRYHAKALMESVGQQDPNEKTAQNTKDTFELLKEFFGKFDQQIGRRQQGVPMLVR